MTYRVVEPRSVRGLNMSLAQLWGSGPKMTVGCGACPAQFRGRIQMVDNPTLRCPYCGAWNELPLELSK